MRTAEGFSEVGFKLLKTIGLAVVLEQTLDALTSALYVICSVEHEAASLRERATTERLKEHWRGRQEAAWTIRRHAEKLEPAIQVLHRLIPAITPAEQSSRADLKKQIKRAKSLGRPPPAPPRDP